MIRRSDRPATPSHVTPSGSPNPEAHENQDEDLALDAAVSHVAPAEPPAEPHVAPAEPHVAPAEPPAEPRGRARNPRIQEPAPEPGAGEGRGDGHRLQPALRAGREAGQGDGSGGIPEGQDRGRHRNHPPLYRGAHPGQARRREGSGLRESAENRPFGRGGPRRGVRPRDRPLPDHQGQRPFARAPRRAPRLVGDETSPLGFGHRQRHGRGTRPRPHRDARAKPPDRGAHRARQPQPAAPGFRAPLHRRGRQSAQQLRRPLDAGGVTERSKAGCSQS